MGTLLRCCVINGSLMMGLIFAPPRPPNAQEDLFVSGLIDFDIQRCNSDKIKDLFEVGVASAIESIPLLDKWPIDRPFWWYEKDGFYSVRSGYKLGMMDRSIRFKDSLSGVSHNV